MAKAAGASRRQGRGKPIGTPGTLAIGALVGAFLAGPAGVPLTLGAALGALVLYLASCAVYPYAACPWCRGRSTKRGDGSGHYRRAAECWVCEGKDFRRLGARLMGRG